MKIKKKKISRKIRKTKKSLRTKYKSGKVSHPTWRAKVPRTKTSIEFCKKCKAIMIPVKKGKNTIMKCRRCNYSVKEAKKIRIVEEKQKTKGIVVLEKNDTPLPMTNMECDKCGNINAWYWLQQTREADEPPTQFFRCTKCRHVWREYK